MAAHLRSSFGSVLLAYGEECAVALKYADLGWTVGGRPLVRESV